MAEQKERRAYIRQKPYRPRYECNGCTLLKKHLQQEQKEYEDLLVEYKAICRDHERTLQANKDIREMLSKIQEEGSMWKDSYFKCKEVLNKARTDVVEEKARSTYLKRKLDSLEDFSLVDINESFWSDTEN